MPRGKRTVKLNESGETVVPLNITVELTEAQFSRYNRAVKMIGGLSLQEYLQKQVYVAVDNLEQGLKELASG